MTSSAAWGPGYVIAQKFRLVRRLGQGGMGSVWAADHLALNSQVAVKIIDPAIASNPEAIARFLREAQSAAALRSPHVVQTFDYGVEDGVPYIAMEMLEGQSLAQRLESVGRLSLEDTARILTDVGRAISRAHDGGIIHRDLKPDNIFLVHNDDEEIAKVLDFGIAKATGTALGNSSQTRTGAILGTPYYMSPEQAEGNRSVDHRTDLWSLAIIAFECVTGKRPFSSEALGDLILQICVRPIKKPSAVLPGLPAAFDEWFEKGTQRDPALRFQSARDLTTGLRAAAGLRASGDGKQRAGLQSYVDVREQAPFAQTPDPLGGSGPRKLSATTGGGVANTSSGAQMPTPVIVGATLGALALAGTVAFFALRGHGDAAGAASAAPAEHAAAAPPEPAALTKKAEPEVVPAPEPKPAEVEGAVPAPEPPTAHARPVAKPAAKPAPRAPAVPAPKPAVKTTTPKRVDFGF